MRRLKVLHIYRTYFPETQGGLQEAIRQFCLATQPLGVENTIFALARNPDPRTMVLPEGTLIRARSWLEIASCDFGGWSAIQSCRRAAESADLIQMHYPWPFADMLMPFIKRKGQPLIVTYVSDIVRQRGLENLYTPLRRYLLNSADRIVASSPNYADSSEVLQQYKDKLTCIPHCLGLGEDNPSQLLDYWQQRLGNDFFLFVGVLRYYKGLDFLLAAAEKTQSRIVVVGDGPEGNRLKKIAKERKLDNVIFLGALSDANKFSLYDLCRAVVFPSHLRSEAFGITLLESARAAKPMITCEIGTGTTWVNRHMETGLVIPPEDPKALAHAINQLQENTELCQRLGRGANMRWKSHFSPEIVGQAYRRLYDELLFDRT